MESFSYERCSKVFLWSLLIVWLASPEAKTWRWGNTTLSGLALRPLEVELSQWIKQRIDLELSAGEHEAKERKIQKSILCFVNCDNILIYGRFTAWHGFNLNRTVLWARTMRRIFRDANQRRAVKTRYLPLRICSIFVLSRWKQFLLCTRVQDALLESLHFLPH